MADQLATFVVDGSLYGVDVMRVQESLRHQPLTPVPHASAASAGLVNLRGQVVLAIDLRVSLGLAAAPEGHEPMMVVVQVHGEPVSLLVDQVGDVVEVDPESFEAPPSTLAPELREFVTGAYKLSDRLLLTLDIERAVAA